MDTGTTLATEAENARIDIADLEAELAAIAESTALVPDDEHDAEGSTVGYERARVTALLTAARVRLHELTSAADRNARGEAGHCESCGASIGDDRLAALPATRICVACATPPAAGLMGRVR